jgi:hypothetical protein
MSMLVGAARLAVAALLGTSLVFAAVRGGNEDAITAVAKVPPGKVAAKNANETEKESPNPKLKKQLDTGLVTALYRVGLQPSHLTAGGVSANDTTSVVAAVKTWLSNNPSALSDADTRMFNAVTNRDKLVRKVVSGLASEDEVAQCQSAKTEFTNADAARNATLSAAFDAGTAGLTSDQKTLLSRIQVNSLAWELPLELCAVDRTEADWVHVRDALTNERISAKLGVDPDADDQSYLSTVRSDSTVSTAKSNLDTHLGDVQSAWETAAAAGG